MIKELIKLTSENKKYINDQVLSHLSNENCLLDVTILEIKIYEREFKKVVSFKIQMRPKSLYEVIAIEFDDVREYSFCSEIGYSNYVESYKLIKLSNGLYYISLDPFNEQQEANDKDQDIVLSSSVSMDVLVESKA